MSQKDLSQPLHHVEFQVSLEEDGLRLDHFLLERITWRSRNDAQKRIRRGEVFVDGATLRQARRVRAGQRVTVLVLEGPATAPVRRDRIPLDFLYEDSDLVALNKPAGVLVHPVGRHVTDTLLNLLHLRAQEAAGGLGPPPMIVHRLDQDTSGVLVLVKTEGARRRLGADFEERRVAKGYLAIVCGAPADPRGLVDAPIGPDEQAAIRIKMCVRADGRPAQTAYEVLGNAGGYSLLRCRPRTGRQHQIRLHLAHLGTPIVGDRLYGRTPSPQWPPDEAPPEGLDGTPLRRQALHAESLEFQHPGSGAPMSLRAPAPPDFAWLLRALPADAAASIAGSAPRIPGSP